LVSGGNGPASFGKSQVGGEVGGGGGDTPLTEPGLIGGVLSGPQKKSVQVGEGGGGNEPGGERAVRWKWKKKKKKNPGKVLGEEKK